MSKRPAILVIKLSALGDFIMSLPVFQAIRSHHQAAKITLLTTAPYKEVAEASGLFDEIWCDSRPRWLEIGAWLELARRLRSGGFDRVYDLQRSDRSALYLRLFGFRKPEWVGVAAGASHRYHPPADPHVHVTRREAAQVALAGIVAVPPADLSFLDSDLSSFNLPRHFAILIPGGAKHRPGKRWPAESYAALARWLIDKGTTPLLLGAEAERDTLGAIAAAVPACSNLCGNTSFGEIAALARRALLVVGNDTGPTHIAAAVGAPAIVLFSGESDPARVAPLGANVTVLRSPLLSDLSLEKVQEAAQPYLAA